MTLKFDRKVDSLQLYPYDGCKVGNNPISSSGINFNATPNSKTVELAFHENVRSNAAVYTTSLSHVDNSQDDSLKLCIYAATIDSNGNEVGFAEVRIKLSYSASGELAGMDIVDGQVNAVTDPVSFSDDFGGLDATMCNTEVTRISQGQTAKICIGFTNAADVSEFRMDRIISCQYDMGDVSQLAINGNMAANVLTEYSYSCGTELSNTCSELHFDSVLKADFFLSLNNGAAKLKLTCLVEVIPMLVDRRLGSESNHQQHELELDLEVTVEPEKDSNLTMIIIGVVGGVCLLCLMCCLCACAKCHHCLGDNDKHCSEEEDDDQYTVKSADISINVGVSPPKVEEFCKTKDCLSRPNEV